jgi:hypothetical protein
MVIGMNVVLRAQGKSRSCAKRAKLPDERPGFPMSGESGPAACARALRNLGMESSVPRSHPRFLRDAPFYAFYAFLLLMLTISTPAMTQAEPSICVAESFSPRNR